MNSARILTTKSFNQGITTVAYMKDGLPYSNNIVSSFNTDIEDDTLSEVRRYLGDSDSLDAGNILSDSKLVDFSKILFPLVNPLTGEADIDKSVYYSPTIPVTVSMSVIKPQYDDGSRYFNPLGVLSRAEFIDSLGILGGADNIDLSSSIDGVARSDDFFSRGYNGLVDGISSPLYNLYSRRDIMKPITRMELAYITVVCWKPFSTLNYSSKGINVDWGKPQVYLSNFRDTRSLNLVKKSTTTVGLVESNKVIPVLDLDIQSYMRGMSMDDYISSIKSGVCLLPVPVFMSLVELYYCGLFIFEGDLLYPAKEVSRGEVSYFIVKLLSYMKRGQ